MSKFSGKCDIYDWFGMIACEEDETPFECFVRRKAKMYRQDNRDYPVKIEKPSDLVPFYPFLMASGAFSSESGDTVVLSNNSYVDDLTGIISAKSVMYYHRELLDEYERIVKEEDPKYVQSH